MDDIGLGIWINICPVLAAIGAGFAVFYAATRWRDKRRARRADEQSG